MTDGVDWTGLPKTAEREIEEIIEFHDGTASASKPVHELISFDLAGRGTRCCR